MKLNIRELGTILAALRSWQQHGLKSRSNVIQEIATDGMSFDALTSEEIDDLAERLNHPETVSDTSPDPARAALEECVRAMEPFVEAGKVILASEGFGSFRNRPEISRDNFRDIQSAYSTARNALDGKE